VKPRVFFMPIAALLSALILYAAIAGIGKASDPPPPQVVEVDRTLQGRDVDGWHQVAAMYRRKLLIRWKPTVQYAYRLAAALYGVSYGSLHSVGGCESNHYPFARNGRYRGVMQEGPMFESGLLGRAGFSVWDPVANVLTAAAVVRHDGSWRQWSCKP
jgi:hypothetical protein